MTQRTVARRVGQHSPPSRGLILGIAIAAIVTAGLIIGIGALIAAMFVAPAAVPTGQQALPSGGQAQPSGGEFRRPAGAVRIGDMLFTVVSVKTLDIKPPEAHLRYVAVELTAQNVGQRTMGNWSIALIDSDKTRNFQIPGSDEEERLRQLGGQPSNFTVNGLKPGEQVQGPLVFKLLADAKPVELQYSAQSGASGVIPLK